MFEIHHQLAMVSRVQYSADECWLYFKSYFDLLVSPSLTATFHVPKRHEMDHDLIIVVREGSCIMLFSTASLAVLKLPDEKGSRFLPVEFHWSTQEQEELHYHDACIQQREVSPPQWFRVKDRHPDWRQHNCVKSRMVLKKIPAFHVTSVIAKQ
eukprot:3762879-Rhodomonas_salina.3